MRKYNIGWGLTNLCNMNCQFCYSKKVRHEIKECKIEDWKKFVDDNHENIDSINYGTGENTLMDDFFYFVEYIRDKYPDIKQSLTTNGYISERVTQSKEFYNIFANCIDELDVSIDYNDEAKHSHFRGQPCAYKWAVKTLELSHNLGKLCTIVFVGYEETLTEENLDGLFALAKNYDALLRLNIYRPVSKIKEINDRFVLSYDTLVHALKYINDNYQIVSLSDILLGTVFARQTNIKENTGRGSIRILPDGTICPSTYLISEEYRSGYHIKDGKILDKIYFDDFENPITPKECKGCKYEKQCNGGVFDRRILWYGTLNERDPYCPLRLGLDLPDEVFRVTKTDRVSVHDDYLPTLFFKNRD